MKHRVIKGSLTSAAALAVAMAGSSAHGFFEQVFTFADAVAGTGATFFDSVAVDGPDVYVFARTAPAGVDVIQKVASAGTPGQSITTLMDTATWQTLAGTTRLSGQFGSEVVGGEIVFSNSFANAVYEVDLLAGVPSLRASTASIAAATGSGTANLTSTYTIDSTGNLFARDGTSASIIKVDPIGAVSVAITSAELDSVAGSTIINGGLAVDADDRIYWGRNAGNAIYRWDPATSSGVTALSQSDFNSAQGNAPGTSVSFRDLFFAPDGLIYFFELSGRDILAFDPVDPVGTLDVVITRGQLEANTGGGSQVWKLTWFDDNLAWYMTDGASPGFFAIPEPASLSLLGIGALALLRRRGA
ncbi:MAG: PEP-CTERM sorting domain-containing protein [Phycisphaeraceae bacterium]|nr:PEP-CTERM sorting domain-containing protein [Phycisphaeraceae bacterium]